MRHLLIIVGTLCLCCLLYYWFDNIWNGMFLDWFGKHYMQNTSYTDNFGGNHYFYRPDWAAIKVFLLWLLLFNVAFWLVVVFMVSRWQSGKAVRAAVTEVSDMIHRYMGENIADAADIFPKEYAEIASQMVELKANRQRHEQMLKEEASRKNDLIAYLAHDLKTPLTSVIGYLSLLDEVPDMPAAQKAKYVHISLDKANRLEKLINEFFEITRYNLQQMVLEPETIDLYYMLVQMSDEFYPALQARGNRIVLHGDETITVYGDAMKLARVFNNILKNAIAYSYANTVIDITAAQTADAVTIQFCNKGKTIPQQRLEAIFDKFFRLDEARTTNSGGAGLGLAIAKEIVALHGGTITADSVQEVTTFTVTLPQQ